MKIGVDYYPEHWPRERWPRDVELMEQAGITVVRMAEFAWSRIEQEPGQIDFQWLDEAVELLANAGIGVVLGTPTATPPKWLCDQAESDGEPIYQVDRQLRVRGFGTRRHYCVNSPRYREETRRIVAEMASRYGSSSAVIAWQIDNEFGCHDTAVCYCENCRLAFARWLAEQYGPIDAVNSAWGTAFWSQEYRSFDEVIVPAFTAVEQPGRYTHNPGLLLDYQRFSTRSIVAYQRLQIDEIRAVSAAPITHNFMGRFSDINYYELAEDLDFVSWDNYPANQWNSSDPTSIALNHDVTRGTTGKNFWVMEQLSGPCGWAVLGPTPTPGQIRLWSYQGIAHGADAIVYFRWRPALFGAEQYWYGILDHDGVPRRRFEEVSQVGAEAKRLSSHVDATTYPADVLLVRSFDNLWSQRFQPHADGLSYDGELEAFYQAARSYGAQIDVSDLPSNLSPDHYSLVIAPLFNLTTGEQIAALRGYVEAGGTLVTTFRSGTRDRHNALRDTVLPGSFADLAGVEVEEFDALSGRRSVPVLFGGNRRRGQARLWVDILSPRQGTEILATYDGDFYAGRPAATMRSVGSGKVYYVGCDLDPAALRAFVAEVAEKAGAASPSARYLESQPDGIEVTLRSVQGAGSGVLFLLNHTDDSVVVHLREAAKDLLTEQAVTQVSVESYGVAILEVSE